MSSSLETFDSFGELLSSLELSNSKLFISELLITSEIVEHRTSSAQWYCEYVN